MFKLCDNAASCCNWAQWKVETPDKQVQFLCGIHRHDLISALEEDQRKKTKIYFCGAVPIQHVNS